VNGVQCDTCRVFALLPVPEGWLLLARQPALSFPSMLDVISGSNGNPELTGTFCTLRCLTEWAYAKLATEGLQGGSHGTEGWIG
jgi:hypothetical protein